MAVGRLMFVILNFSLLIYTITQGAYTLWVQNIPQYLLKIISLYDTYKWLAVSLAELISFIPTLGAVLVSISQEIWALKKVVEHVWGQPKADNRGIIQTLKEQVKLLIETNKKIRDGQQMDAHTIMHLEVIEKQMGTGMNKAQDITGTGKK